MKILVWYGKHGEEYFVASDERKALKFLFTIIDEEYGYYEPEYMDKEDVALYEKAKTGNVRDIHRFMLSRNGHEYEGWEFHNADTEENFKERFGKDL